MTTLFIRDDPHSHYHRYRTLNSQSAIVAILIDHGNADRVFECVVNGEAVVRSEVDDAAVCE
jgi:hypothetical protein